MTYSELIFVDGNKKEPKFILLHMDMQLFQQHVLQEMFFITMKETY